MTDIAFHFNVPDKLAYSCRLLRKVYQSGAQLVVTGMSGMLAELDQMLWTFSATDFIPHYRLAADVPTNALPGTLLAATPVLLAESLRGCAHQRILINLGSNIPDEFERFERFIEVVTTQDEDRLSARRRWKHYADRGYSLQRHDLAAAGEPA